MDLESQLRGSLATFGITPPPREEKPAPDIKPGLYRDISFEEYLSWPFVHHSDLVKFNQTAAHVRESMLHPKKDTAAMEFGQAYHTAILEPGRFAKEYIASITTDGDGKKLDRRYKAGKAAWEEFEKNSRGMTILDPDDYDTLIGMQRRLWRHPSAKELLSAPGHSEVSIVWVDDETGLKCKARIDRVAVYGGYPYLIDLKTTDRDASERSVSITISSYKYHQQAGMYHAGMEALFPGPYRKFAFIFQEKARPYEPSVNDLDDIALAQGKSQFRKHINRFRECLDTGEWPGYGDGIGLVGIQQWAMNQEDIVG